MHNPMSIEALLDWLKTKPQNDSYDYYLRRCLIGEYFEDHLGLKVEYMGTRTWKPKEGGDCRSLPPHFDEVANPGSNKDTSTYGEAAARAQAILDAN